MGNMKKGCTRKGCVSAERIEIARIISKLKGEDFDELLAQFTAKYVDENRHILIEKIKEIMPQDQ